MKVVLVYQPSSRLANVIQVRKFDWKNPKQRQGVRLLQDTVANCEVFMRGLIASGIVSARTATCKFNGDVIFEEWDKQPPKGMKDLCFDNPDPDRRFFSLYFIKCDDGRFELETDGPHDELTRNVRAATWKEKEAEKKDQIFKVELRDGRMITDIFEEADLNPAVVETPL